MIKLKYSLQRDFPEWTGEKEYDEDKMIKKQPENIDDIVLCLKQIVDKIILSIETLENDEIVAFEIKGK